MNNKHYDVIFVGEGLISLTAAATLAKQGKTVLLLNGSDRIDAGIPSASFRFSLGPLLYFGYEKWGAVEGYFSQLSYPIPSLKEKGLLFKKITPLLQLILPSHRLNLYTEEEAYFDELKREFGPQFQHLKTLFDQVSREAAFYYPYIGQFQQLEIEGVAERINEWKKTLDFSQAIREQQKKSAMEMLDPFKFSASLRKYFNLLTLFAFKKPIASVSAFEMIRLLSSFQKGGVSMQGGYPTLVTFFQNLIRNWGGSLLENKAISKLELKKKHVTGICLSDGTSLSSDYVVVAQTSKKRTLDFYFAIRTALIPIPMKESLLMSWGGHIPKQAEDLLVIRLNPPEGETEHSTSKDRLIVVSVLLREGITVSVHDHESLQEQVLERLYGLIPFSRSEIKPVIPKTEGRPEGDGSRGEQTTIFLPSEKKVGTTKEVLKGVFRYSHPKGQKNVYLVDSGQSDYLCWGSDFIAGHRLAKLIDQSK